MTQCCDGKPSGQYVTYCEECLRALIQQEIARTLEPVLEAGRKVAAGEERERG